ncbi:hypothetical protein JNK13_11430 [bacterium]|nr:hypothetical protein [bacterium]
MATVTANKLTPNYEASTMKRAQDLMLNLHTTDKQILSFMQNVMSSGKASPELMMQLQKMQDMRNNMISMLSNMIKSASDTMRSIVSNMRN